MGRKSYGPIQLGQAVGLERWQVQRGLWQGLIPPAGDSGRWTQEQADDVAARHEDIVAVLGMHPGYGGWRAADMLQAALGDVPAAPDEEGLVPGEVWNMDVETLAARGVLTAVGTFKGHTLYDTRQLADPTQELLEKVREVVAERLDWWARSMTTTAAARRCGWTEAEFTTEAARAGITTGTGGRWALTDVEALATDDNTAEQVAGERLLTADQAAQHLEIRRSDLEHARAAGWLTPHTWTTIPVGRRSTVEVPLYLTRDVDALREVPGVDWEEVRAVRPGRPSPLLQYVGPGRTRAQAVRAFARRVRKEAGVPFYARYQPGPGRWVVDWVPSPVHLAVDTVEQLLDSDPACEYRAGIELLSRSGRAVCSAAALLRPGTAVVLDTETTALDGSVIEITVVDAATGEVLLDTLVAPPDGIRITPRSEAVHGISPGMLTGAPTLDKLWGRLTELTEGKTVLAYNAPFDHGRLCHDTGLLGLPSSHLTRWSSWECLMGLRGDWEGTTSWLPLGTRYHRPEDGAAHRARADALAAVRLLHDLTEAPSWWGQPV